MQRTENPSIDEGLKRLWSSKSKKIKQKPVEVSLFLASMEQCIFFVLEENIFKSRNEYEITFLLNWD